MIAKVIAVKKNFIVYLQNKKINQFLEDTVYDCMVYSRKDKLVARNKYWIITSPIQSEFLDKMVRFGIIR